MVGVLAGLVGRFGAGFAATLLAEADFFGRFVRAFAGDAAFCRGVFPTVIRSVIASSLNVINSIFSLSELFEFASSLPWNRQDRLLLGHGKQ
ncbi:MAG: hypothetical protein D4R84_16095 [Rhodocyclaceae bacterium]|nr:MAG: hypothetical protein D4R84_16095 [Rhodocyclaceae bacterium]